jgi:hypothetical protein
MTNSSGNAGAATRDGYDQKLCGNLLSSSQFADHQPFPRFLLRPGFIT